MNVFFVYTTTVEGHKHFLFGMRSIFSAASMHGVLININFPVIVERSIKDNSLIEMDAEESVSIQRDRGRRYEYSKVFTAVYKTFDP
jgi:hypothetical protein